MKIVITIPAYNEEKTIANIIREIKLVMGKTMYNYSILVVNDGSNDKTEKIAKQNGVLVISHKRNLGLAETFKTEMKKCIDLKADIIVHTDSDGQYPSSYIPSLIKKIEEGYDLVLGSRFGKGKYAGSFLKKLGNKLFARVFSGLLKTKLSDTTTGFRAFNLDVAKLPLINSFTYTQEQLIRAGKANMRVTEIPINTNKTRESRLFKGPIDYAIKAWINIFRIYRDFEPLKFFGRISWFLFVLSFFLFVYIFIKFMQFGLVQLDRMLPSIILATLFFLTGLQILLFGFLADMNRK